MTRASSVLRASAAGICVALGCYITSLGHHDALPALWMVSIALGIAAAFKLLEVLFGRRSPKTSSIAFGLGFFVLSLTQFSHGPGHISLAWAALISTAVGVLAGTGARFLLFRH